MIIISDNFLDQETFAKLQNYCKNDFRIVQAGDKEFRVLDVPKEILPFLHLEGYEIIRTFVRSADKGFDTDLRIHNDGTIDGFKTSMASVLYISGDEVSKNGTRFHKHHKYGLQAPDDLSDEEFNRLILEDSNDATKWTNMDIVVGVPNRRLLYSSQLFHSKFPSKIKRGVRKVLVTFYFRETN